MLNGLGYPKQDKLTKALVTNLTTETLDATSEYDREVSRVKGIDRILKNYNVHVTIGPTECSMTDSASASGSWELRPCLFAVSIDVSSGYPIASLPLGYLDFNGTFFYKIKQIYLLILIHNVSFSYEPSGRAGPKSSGEK